MSENMKFKMMNIRDHLKSEKTVFENIEAKMDKN